MLICYIVRLSSSQLEHCSASVDFIFTLFGDPSHNRNSGQEAHEHKWGS